MQASSRRALLGSRYPRSGKKQAMRAIGWVSEEIFIHNVTHQPAALPNLPQELFMRVAEGLNWPDMVAMALTCKTLANKTQDARIHFGKTKDDNNAIRTWAAIKGVVITARKKFGLRARVASRAYKAHLYNKHKPLAASSKLVCLDLLRQIHSFFPAHRFRLCYGCIKYRPWAGTSGGWGGNGRYKDASYKSREAHAKGPRCQNCVMNERRRLFALRKYMSRLRRRARG